MFAPLSQSSERLELSLTDSREKFTLEELYPVIKETLDNGGEFSFISHGTSMSPMLGNGTHKIYLKKQNGALGKNDIPLVRRADGSFVLHRIIGKNKDGYIICGDRQLIYEYGIKDEMIVGVLSGYEKIGEGKIHRPGDKDYKKYLRKLSIIRPLKHFYHKARDVFK